jgi:hypothetical protein
MLSRNVTVNGKSFSGATARTNRVSLERFTQDVTLATFQLQKQTAAGTILGRAVPAGRLFTLSGKVFGTDAERQAGIDWVNAACAPDDLISASPLFDLTWYDLDGTQFKTRAQVYEMPTWEHNVSSPVASWTFRLLSPDATFKGYVDESSAGSGSMFGGMTLSTVLPATMGGDTYLFTLTNAGNYPAPLKVTVTGAITDPQIRNLTNGRRYGLTGRATSSLVMDATVAPFSVLDAGSDVSGFRSAGSVSPMLSPGVNTLAVSGALVDPLTPPSVTFEWNDTYISG